MSDRDNRRPTPSSSDDQAPWEPQGPALDTDGRLHGEPHVTPGEGRVLPFPARQQEEPLELAERAPRKEVPTAPRLEGDAPVLARAQPQRVRGTTTARRLVQGILTATVALILIMYAGPRYVPGLFRAPKKERPASERSIAPSGSAPAGTLMVLSTPSGATVRVQGKVVGQTPLALDNHWTGAEVPVVVELAGYRPWRGSIQGGEAAHVNAELRRR